MPKKKNNFPDSKYYKEMIEQYCVEHGAELRAHMLHVVEIPDMDTLWNKEYHMGFGLDCGWLIMFPKNKEMFDEWRRDKSNYYDGGCRVPVSKAYNTQSTTLQRIIAEKVFEDLQLDTVFTIMEYLD